MYNANFPNPEDRTYVVSKSVVGQESVRGVNLYIERLVWQNGCFSFDVFRDYDRECLTMDESFDEYPTQAQLDNLMEEKGLA